VQLYLAARGRWNADREQASKQELEAEIRAAMEQAATYPAPKPQDVFDHVYANPPARVASQREELMRRFEA